jgi:hypothetical protein
MVAQSLKKLLFFIEPEGSLLCSQQPRLNFILNQTIPVTPVSIKFRFNIVMDLIKALLRISSVNMVQHTTKEEAVFSVEPNDAPIDWMDSDHVIYVSCRSMSVPFRGARGSVVG